MQFYKEFRKWQSAAPLPSAGSGQAAAKYAASDHYWQGKTSPRPDILVLDDGATLRARGGQLEVFSRGVTQAFDAGRIIESPKAIIFAGWEVLSR